MTKTRIVVRAAIIGLAIVIVLLAMMRLRTARRASVPPAPDTYGSVPEFELTERSGRTVTLNDLSGRVWVGDFIFTRCSGPCPVLTSRMAMLQKEFTDEEDVRFVSFSVDPEYDSPEVLSRYAEAYGADPERWLFLTGRTENVRRLILGGFKLAMDRDESAPVGESVNHSLRFVLVDQKGDIRGYYTATDKSSLDQLRSDLRALL
jgi:protein SCO1